MQKRKEEFLFVQLFYDAGNVRFPAKTLKEVDAEGERPTHRPTMTKKTHTLPRTDRDSKDKDRQQCT